MAGWGTKQNATQLTNITTEQFFSTTPTLKSREVLDGYVNIDFPSTPTDDAIIALYKTLDDSSETWIKFGEIHVDKSLDNVPIPILVSGIYRLRIGVRRDGSTDTLTDADFSYRLNGEGVA